MNFIRNCFYVTTKCQFIKSSYVYWLQKFFKSLTDINPDFMKSYFTIKEIPCCLRNVNFLKIPSTRSKRYGTNSILFPACLV